MIRIYITDKKTTLRTKKVKYSDVFLLAGSVVELCRRLDCPVYEFILMMRSVAAAENNESEENEE